MTTKFDIGEEVSFSNISFVIRKIKICDKNHIRYKIGIIQHDTDYQGYPDDYCVGEFYVDENQLERESKGVTFW